MNRRRFLAAGAGAGAVALGGPRAARAPTVDSVWPVSAFKHSVCRWPFRQLSVEELARMARELGLDSLELLERDEWPIARRHGLSCAMGYAAVPEPQTRLTRGFNRVEHHGWLIPAYERTIPLAAASGVPSLICFSGNRDGQDDEEGLEICARGIAALLPAAERHGVTICMELLNSKVDHPGYQCDRTPWGVALVKRLGSERFKLLYDIYHMQIMEGDLAPTVEKNLAKIAHMQLADTPGRHEPCTGEINYPFLFGFFDRIGYKGWIGCEYRPAGNTEAGLGWLKPYL